jgi:hypothetical protein
MHADDKLRQVLREPSRDDAMQAVVLLTAEKAKASGPFPAMPHQPGGIDRDFPVADALAITEGDECLITVRRGRRFAMPLEATAQALGA